MAAKFNQFLLVIFSISFLSEGFAQSKDNVTRLNKASIITRPLLKGHSDMYTLHLGKGGYARVVAEQRGVDVALRIGNPTHKLIEEFDIPTGNNGNEYATISADESGDYYVSVIAVNAAAGGFYTIKVEELLDSGQYRNVLQRRQAYADSAAKYFSQDSLLQNIRLLSSDSLQGRKPGTVGETRTLDFLQSRFKEIGLEPGNGDSYFQEVHLPAKFATTWVSPLAVNAGNKKLVLKERDDFVLFPHFFDTSVSMKDIPLVFAGYGIVSSKYHRDDYKGLDVKDKIVLLLRNPYGKFDDSLKSYSYKNKEAAKHGALGCLYIFDSAMVGYAFRIEYDLAKEGNYVPESDSRSNKKMGLDVKIDGDVTLAAAQKILLLAGLDTALLNQVDSPNFRGAQLPASISVEERANIVPSIISRNVIGKITGSTYPNEYVVYSGHWDHLGIGVPDVHGDSIYNGAWDNAAGTSGVIELAKAFSRLPQKPARTVLFINFTEEEYGGHLGSVYYTKHPVYPLEGTVADINLDCLNILGKATDFYVCGTQLSTLEDLVKEEAEREGRWFGYDSSIVFSSQNAFFFSDQLSFAKAGVPGIFSGGGSRPIGMKAATLSALLNKEMGRYHQPTDEYDPSFWKLDGAVEDLFILYKVGCRLADGKIRPEWRSGAPYRRPTL